MDTAFNDMTWYEAVRAYLIHLKAVRAANTVHFYETQLKMLSRWAEANNVPLDKFSKRHLDE